MIWFTLQTTNICEALTVKKNDLSLVLVPVASTDRRREAAVEATVFSSRCSLTAAACDQHLGSRRSYLPIGKVFARESDRMIAARKCS